jgi:signal transduction histidine kinase
LCSFALCSVTTASPGSANKIIVNFDLPFAIFSAFFTTKAQGSGMGLSVSRSIVESHGGRLWVAADEGRGATFHFNLPTQFQ